MRAQRVRYWEQRLQLLLGNELAVPFDWTSSNCGHLMCASIAACLGEDHPALALQDQFTSDIAVKKMVVDAGGVDAIIAKYFEPIPLFHLMRGDLVVVEIDGQQAGAVWMDGAIVAKAEAGVHASPGGFRLPRSAAKIAFGL